MTIFGLGHPLNAQGVDYNDVLIDRYSLFNGFNSGQGICIDQDTIGYVWIGTETGLIRYDGQTFKKFTHNIDNKNSIPSNYVSSLVIDIHNRMWLVAGDALVLFNLNNNIFTETHIKHDKLRIHYDRACDIMWIYSPNRIYSNDGLNINIKPVNLNTNLQHIHNINTLKNGNLIITSLDSIFILDLSNKHLERKIINTNFKTEIISSFIESDSIIWFGSWTNGLLKYHIYKNKFERFLFSKNGQNAVLSITKNNQNKNLLWLATNKGIKIFNRNDHAFSSIEGRNDKIDGAGFSVYDAGDIVWFGTYKGLYKLDYNKQMIKTIKLNLAFDATQSRIENVWFKTKQKKDSIIYISFEYGGILKYDLINHKVISWDKKIAKYFHRESQINSSLYTIDESFYIASQKYGMLKIDLNNNTVTQFRFINNINPFVFDIYKTKESPIYLSTTSGSFIIDEKNSSILPNITINEYLDKNKLKGVISTPTEDLEGNMWYIFCNSLDCHVILHNKKSEKIHLFTAENCKAVNKMKIITNKVLNKKNGRIYFTSFNGLAYTNSLNGEPTLEFPKSNDIRYNRGMHNIISVDNTLWLSTDFGIMWHTKNILTDLNYFNSKIGTLPQPKIFFSSNSNQIYIGQTNQLNVIAPKEYKNLGTHKIHLSDMSINGQSITLLPNNGQIIPIGSDDHNIRFEFTNLNFTNSTENIYQYHTPEDTTWRNLPSNYLNFEKLPHGLNTFYIRAISNFGYTSKNIYELKLDVEPKFYYRWWFIMFCLAMIIFFIYSIFKYRDDQRLKLEKIRYNIARDLHDDMGSTLTQIKMISEYEAIKSKHPNFQIISQKLGDVMNSMSEIVWSINPKYDTLNEVILKIQEFAIEVFESSNINLKFDISDYNDKLQLNTEQKRHLYLIFKEAINNCIKYSKAKNVVFKIEQKRQKIHISLIDDGIGFSTKLIKQGNGLKNMESRAKALGGNLHIQSDFDGTSISLVLF